MSHFHRMLPGISRRLMPLGVAGWLAGMTGQRLSVGGSVFRPLRETLPACDGYGRRRS